MRKANLLLFFFMAITAGLFQSCGKTHADLTSFYKDHRHGEGVTNITLPKWIVRMGGRIALRHMDGPESRILRPLLGKVGKVRLLFSEEQALWSADEHRSFRHRLRQSGFEDYIHIRDGATQVQFMMLEEEKELRDIVVFFLDEEESGMIAMRTSISVQDVARAVQAFIREQKTVEPEEREEPLARKIPQV